MISETIILRKATQAIITYCMKKGRTLNQIFKKVSKYEKILSLFNSKDNISVIVYLLKKSDMLEKKNRKYIATVEGKKFLLLDILEG
jgi:hypothetical protein